jgi:Family of unknown function (DUF5630)
MQNESGAIRQPKSNSSMLLNLGIFTDTVRKSSSKPGKVIAFIQKCRSDDYICEYAQKNEDFQSLCNRPELQDHWLGRYLEVSDAEPIRPEDLSKFVQFYSRQLNLFELYQGQVYFKNLVSQTESHQWDKFGDLLLQTLECGSLKALRWYLDAILSEKYTDPLLEKNEENLLRVAHYARNFARIRLYGSMGYLIWAEAVTHLVLNNPSATENTARCRTIAELIKIAQYLSENPETAQVNTYLTPLLAHTQDVFANNSLEIASYEAAYQKLSNLKVMLEIEPLPLDSSWTPNQ